MLLTNPSAQRGLLQDAYIQKLFLTLDSPLIEGAGVDGIQNMILEQRF